MLLLPALPPAFGVPGTSLQGAPHLAEVQAPTQHPARFWTRAIPTNVLASINWPYAAAGEPQFAINRWGAMSATWEDQAVAGNPLGPVGMALSDDSGQTFGNSFPVGPLQTSGFEFDVAQTAHSPNGTMWYSYGADPGTSDNTYTTVIWNNGTHLSEPEISIPAATTGNNFLDRDWIMSTPNGTVVSVVDSCPGNTCPNIYESTAWNGYTFNPVVQLYSNGDTTASADALNNDQWLVGDQATPNQPGVCQLITTNDSGATWQGAPSAPAGCGSMTWQMVWGAGPAVDIVFLNSAGTAVLFSQTFNWGRTWTTPVTLSGAPPAGTVFQTPTITADPATGEIAVFWLDTRANPGAADWNVYETDSPDNGASWTPLQQISSAVVGTGSGFWSGDWIWSQLTPWGTAGVIWGDNRTNTRLLTEFAQVPYENTNDGNLTVTVVDGSSVPVPNAYVTVGGQGGRTSSAGTITFYNLAPGTLFCTGYKPGVGNGFANGSVAAGSTSSVQIQLAGSAPPPLSASISATPSVGHAPLSVSLTSQVSGGYAPYGFSWRFGDGGSAITQNATYTYTTPGNYTATFWVNDSASTSVSHQVSVAVYNPYTPVSVSATATPSSLAAGSSLLLTASPSGGTGSYSNYTWSGLPTGCPSRAYLPSFSCSPTAPGHWNATVAVTDNLGHTGSGVAEVDAWASGGALAVAIAATPRAFALGGSLSLTATPSGGSGTYTSFVWSALPTGCTSADQATLSCTPSGAGHFNSTVTVHDSSGASATNTVEVDIWALPGSLAVSLSATPASLALGGSTSLSATPTGGTQPYLNYAWGSLPTGCNPANLPTLPCTPSGAGHFNTSVLVTDSAGNQASNTVEVNVWLPPTTLAVSILATPSSLATGRSLTLAASVTGGTGSYSVFTWGALPVGCPAADQATITCSPTTAGHYNVTLTVADTSGHVGNAKREVDVYGASSAGSGSTGGLFGMGAIGTLVLVALVAAVVAAVAVAAFLHHRRKRQAPAAPTEMGGSFVFGSQPPP